MSHPAFASRVTHFIMEKDMKKISLVLLFVMAPLGAKKVASVQKDAVQKTVVLKPSQKQHNKTEKKVEDKKPDLILEDKIAGVIYTDHDPIILTHKELSRPFTINGQPQTKDDITKARKMEYDAIYVWNMPIPEEAINNYIKSLKNDYGMTNTDLAEKFDKAGYSYEEGIEELRRMLVVGNLFDFKIKSRLVVPEDEVRAYYNSHSQEVPAMYQIRKGFLSEGILTPEERKDLKNNGKHSDLVDWMSSYWLGEDDLADSLKHIATLENGAIVVMMPTGNGYELIQLVKKKPKRTRSFEEAYKEIADILRKPLFEKLVKQYEDELDKKYKVIYF